MPHSPAPTPPALPPRSHHWDANKRLVCWLLLVWGLVSIGASILLVEPLNRLRLGRLPLGFWFGQQGAMVVFVALIFIYARRMDRLDRQHDN